MFCKSFHAIIYYNKWTVLPSEQILRSDAATLYSIFGGGATALSKTANMLGKSGTLTKEFNLFSKGSLFFNEYSIEAANTIKTFVNLPKPWFRVVNGIGAGVDSLLNGKKVVDAFAN